MRDTIAKAELLPSASKSSTAGLDDVPQASTPWQVETPQASERLLAKRLGKPLNSREVEPLKGGTLQTSGETPRADPDPK